LLLLVLLVTVIIRRHRLVLLVLQWLLVLPNRHTISHPGVVMAPGGSGSRPCGPCGCRARSRLVVVMVEVSLTRGSF